MEILSQFINDLKSLENNIYLTNINLDALVNNNTISEDLTNLIFIPEVKDLVTLLTSKLSELNSFLEPIAIQAHKETTKKQYHKSIEQYAKFIIDPVKPIIEDNSNKPIQLSFEDIIKENPIRPIKHRTELEYTDVCPYCGAPNEYIYDNNHRGQFMCKACKHTFTMHPHYHDEISIRCPHCGYKLFLHHDRNDYDVLVCPNDNCKFYLENKHKVKVGDGEHLKVNKSNYKLRYTYRAFNFTLEDINKTLPYNIDSKVDLNSIRHSKWALGLILTYYVNYGLSSRKTAQVMKEIHGISISHQTVMNYVEAAASITENLNALYKYDLSDTTTFDETYIKVNSKNTYVFFGSDTNNKIITSYRIFPHRNTKNAIITLKESYDKFKDKPDKWTVITDGNPIYNATQLFFKMNDIEFDLYQVIGVSNKDETSIKYRPFKQAEERLNRTYKQNYYGTNGYGNIRNANVYISIWTTFYNFLRKHSSIKKIPVTLKEIESEELMPNKWLKLIDYANRYPLVS